MALYTPKEEPLPKHCEYSCVCHKSSMDIGVFGWDTGSDKRWFWSKHQNSCCMANIWKKEANVLLEQ